METLLYLYDTAGLPAEVILMVIEYAVDGGKYHMRYIEKVALDWADRGIDTIDKAEQYLCRLDRRRQAWGDLQRPLRHQAVAHPGPGGRGGDMDLRLGSAGSPAAVGL